ncbi:MAG: CopG family ribbon-helix-helix protein [Candidatus Bilamarchaeaceae archaeon]
MEIISMSIDRKTSEGISALQRALGFKSRSKLIRSALASFIDAQRSVLSISGKGTVVFTLTRDEHAGTGVSGTISKFGHLVRSNIHHHSRKGCIDIIIAEGEGDELRDLLASLRSAKGTRSVFVSVI